MIRGIPATGRLFATVGLILGSALAGPSAAQTPDSSCTRDALFLRSPAVESLSVTLSEGARLGTIVSWAVPDPATASCAAVQGSGLGFGVEVVGSYRDNLDRELLFTSKGRGQVGGQENLLFSWSNRHVGRSGLLTGELNLSNSGGLLRRESGTGAWARLNTGLPNYLNYTNIMSLAQSPHQAGRLLVGLDASQPGSELGLRPRGLWEKPGPDAPWRRLLPQVFHEAEAARALAYSPHEDGTFAVGGSLGGLFIVRQHGETWQAFARNLDPGHATPPSSYLVDALTWAADGRLFVGIRGFGLFVTENAGASWRRLNLRLLQNPSDPNSALRYPRVQHLAVDPADPAHLLVALPDYGIHHSLDGGTTWEPLYGDWLNPGGGSRANGLTVTILEGPGPVILLGTAQRGLWRSPDGGLHWEQVADLLPAGRTWSTVAVPTLAEAADALYVLLNGVGIARSFDRGATWALLDFQPTVLTGTRLQADRHRPGDILLATTGGGVYTPGNPIPLTQTIDPSNISSGNVGRDLGFSLTFHEGPVDSAQTFVVKAQDFQGYAVWRSEENRPFDFQLIGLYDKTNPETCIEGYCGDPNFTIRPLCFGEKRAGCFDFRRPGIVSFFDDNVYNGYTYFYAVSTVDYGNTAGINPAALTSELLFSPRYPSPESRRLDSDREIDGGSVYPGEGNLVRFQVNLSEQPDEDGEEIYVFPNPLRRPEEVVRFTNLPAESRIEVFTVDGDRVASLPKPPQQPQTEGNIYWDTRNPDGQQIASGIYIWRVQMPKRGDFWGKLVIIR